MPWPRIRCAIVAIGFSLSLLAAPLYSQTPEAPTDSLSFDLVVPEFSPLSFLLAYVPSEFFGGTQDLKAYIRNERFQRLRSRFGDQRAADAIFLQAYRRAHGNTAIALLMATAATMDHRLVGIRVPLLKLFLPLTNESAQEFATRIDHLPRQLYADSPPSSVGDRDKLQHFFGSAFVAYIFESRNAAARIGRFIEWGEDAFIVNGVLDDRDERANRHGQEFGLALLCHPSTSDLPLPSQFLKMEIAEESTKDTTMTFNQHPTSIDELRCRER